MSYWSGITKTLLVIQQRKDDNNHHVHHDELTALLRHSPITIVRYLMKAATTEVLSLSNNSSRGSSVSTMSVGTMSIGWSSSIGGVSIGWSNSVGNRGRLGIGSNRDLADSVDWGVDSLADSLD